MHCCDKDRSRSPNLVTLDVQRRAKPALIHRDATPSARSPDGPVKTMSKQSIGFRKALRRRHDGVVSTASSWRLDALRLALTDVCVGSATVLACSRESAVKCAASIPRARQRVPYHFTRTLRVEVDEHWSASRRRYRRRRINRCCCLSGRLLSSAVEPIAVRGVAALPWRCDGVFTKRCAGVSQQLSSTPSLKLPAGQQALRRRRVFSPPPRTKRAR